MTEEERKAWQRSYYRKNQEMLKAKAKVYYQRKKATGWRRTYTMEERLLLSERRRRKYREDKEYREKRKAQSREYQKKHYIQKTNKA